MKKVIILVSILLLCGCGETLKESSGGGGGSSGGYLPPAIAYHNPSYNYTDDGVSINFTVTKNYLSSEPEYRKPYFKQVKYTGFDLWYYPSTPKISEYLSVVWTDPNPGVFTVRTIDTSITINASGFDNEYFISYGNGDNGSWYFTVMPLRGTLHLSQLEKVSGNFIELRQGAAIIQRINMWEI